MSGNLFNDPRIYIYIYIYICLINLNQKGLFIHFILNFCFEWVEYHKVRSRLYSNCPKIFLLVISVLSTFADHFWEYNLSSYCICIVLILITTNILDNGHQFWNVLKVKFNEKDLENFYASLDLYFHHFIDWLIKNWTDSRFGDVVRVENHFIAINFRCTLS